MRTIKTSQPTPFLFPYHLPLLLFSLFVFRVGWCGCLPILPSHSWRPDTYGSLWKLVTLFLRKGKDCETGGPKLLLHKKLTGWVCPSTRKVVPKDVQLGGVRRCQEGFLGRKWHYNRRRRAITEKEYSYVKTQWVAVGFAWCISRRKSTESHPTRREWPYIYLIIFGSWMIHVRRYTLHKIGKCSSLN